MRENNPINTYECFADDITKLKKTFWAILSDWEKDSFDGIYSNLPDVDRYSSQLYNYHQYLWNKQKDRFSGLKSITELHIIYDYAYQLNMDNKNIALGSDSIISIYFHRKDMKEIMKNIGDNIAETDEYKLFEKESKELDKYIKGIRYYNNKWIAWKKFIWRYLQKSNTIGGFIVFPKHDNLTVNTARGNSDKIKDRFDLTIECIRRYYENSEKSLEDNSYNPLFSSLNKEHIQKDIEFFEMFGSFKNYVDFFCLQDWVNDKYEVLDLLGYTKTTLLNADKVWKENKVLPCDFETDDETKVKKWWNLYHNLMYRLEKRNKRIEEILNSKK